MGKCYMCGGFALSDTSRICLKCQSEAEINAKKVEKQLNQPIGFGWNKAIQRMHCAPAQEEKKEMTCKQVGEPLTCRLCKKIYTTDLVDTLICDTCRERGAKERATVKRIDLTEELRMRWDCAFFAALGPLSLGPDVKDPVAEAHILADETIRRHADMMASRDAIIAEVVG